MWDPGNMTYIKEECQMSLFITLSLTKHKHTLFMTLASRLCRAVFLWGQVTGCGDLQSVLGRAHSLHPFISDVCARISLCLSISLHWSWREAGINTCFLPMVSLFSRSGLETWVKARLGGWAWRARGWASDAGEASVKFSPRRQRLGSHTVMQVSKLYRT